MPSQGDLRDPRGSMTAPAPFARHFRNRDDWTWAAGFALASFLLDAGTVDPSFGITFSTTRFAAAAMACGACVVIWIAAARSRAARGASLATLLLAGSPLAILLSTRGPAEASLALAGALLCAPMGAAGLAIGGMGLTLAAGAYVAGGFLLLAAALHRFVAWLDPPKTPAVDRPEVCDWAWRGLVVGAPLALSAAAVARIATRYPFMERFQAVFLAGMVAAAVGAWSLRADRKRLRWAPLLIGVFTLRLAYLGAVRPEQAALDPAQPLARSVAALVDPGSTLRVDPRLESLRPALARELSLARSHLVDPDYVLTSRPPATAAPGAFLVRRFPDSPWGELTLWRVGREANR